MNDRINPFNEVYVTESIASDKFVNLFSPILVESALGLFQPGHIILKGLIGTGKSMLLNLLKPDIRLSYFRQNQNFPVPNQYKKFVGAGINLRRSGISDFGQRPIVADGFASEEISPIFFGDFLNYWIVSDILKALECLNHEPGLASEIGIRSNSDNLNQFAIEISQEDCWQGYLNGISNYDELKNRLANRITQYRSYLNYNSSELDASVKSSKTIVGIPIIKTVHHLKELKIVDEDVEFYVRLDQYEDLERINNSGSNLGTKYQEIVHKLLGMRDYSVSYKIGTRDFAWTKERKIIFGTSATIERKRDYNEISIEELLKRNENSRTWIFPRFANDIFTRRLRFVGYDSPDSVSESIKYTFESSLVPQQKIDEFYIRSDSSRKNALALDKNWPDKWNGFLLHLAEKNLLSARLAEAWAKQKGKQEIVNNIPKDDFPWEKKIWWRKERIEQALMQIASRNRQRLHWSGYEDIIDLSGGSILAFIYISKYIWDSWLKDNKTKTSGNVIPKISRDIQSLGIEKASYYWFEDINQETGGDRRKKFIRFLGNFFYEKLSSDEAMTYPGHNGFSLEKDDLESDQLVNTFLRESSDFGDLDNTEHTSRTKSQGKRIKWHLSKILSPYFKIPSAHTKEPYYTRVSEVREWLAKSETFTEKELNLKRDKGSSNSQTQLLF